MIVDIRLDVDLDDARELLLACRARARQTGTPGVEARMNAVADTLDDAIRDAERKLAEDAARAALEATPEKAAGEFQKGSGV